MYGICSLSVIPCRKEAANSSEMVTQLLFGEHYTILEQAEEWIRIQAAYDKYECWINKKQHTKISESTFKLLEIQHAILNGDLFQLIKNKTDNTVFPVSIGATLPGYLNKE